MIFLLAGNDYLPWRQPEMSPLMENTGYLAGSDFASLTVESAAACAARCGAVQDCVAMTFIKSTRACYLKDAITETASSPDMVSARKFAQ
jgi:hypothetical protein